MVRRLEGKGNPGVAPVSADPVPPPSAELSPGYGHGHRRLAVGVEPIFAAQPDLCDHCARERPVEDTTCIMRPCCLYCDRQAILSNLRLESLVPRESMVRQFFSTAQVQQDDIFASRTDCDLRSPSRRLTDELAGCACRRVRR